MELPSGAHASTGHKTAWGGVRELNAVLLKRFETGSRVPNDNDCSLMICKLISDMRVSRGAPNNCLSHPSTNYFIGLQHRSESPHYN